MNEYTTLAPDQNESSTDYALRTESLGARELIIRKGLVAHFDFSIDQAIETCTVLSDARHREVRVLRDRFPDLTENRFAWRISQSMTIPKDQARVWAQKILTQEAGV